MSRGMPPLVPVSIKAIAPVGVIPRPDLARIVASHSEGGAPYELRFSTMHFGRPRGRGRSTTLVREVWGYDECGGGSTWEELQTPTNFGHQTRGISGVALVNGTIIAGEGDLGDPLTYGTKLLRSDDFGASFYLLPYNTSADARQFRDLVVFPVRPPPGPVSDVTSFDGSNNKVLHQEFAVIGRYVSPPTLGLFAQVSSSLASNAAFE